MRAIFARIFAALKGAMSWMEDTWEGVSSSWFGQGFGYAWTAAKLPIALAGATVGLELLSKRDVDRIETAGAAVGRAGLSVGKGLAGAAGGAAKVAGAAISDVLALPGQLISAVTGGARAGTPGQAAATATQRAQSEQVKADDQADARVVLASLRRVASSLAKQSRPDGSDLEALPAGLASYVLKLTSDEADTLARSRTAALRSLIDTGLAPEGVRSPKDVSAESKTAAPAAVDNKADSMARLAAKRAADLEGDVAAYGRAA